MWAIFFCVVSNIGTFIIFVFDLYADAIDCKNTLHNETHTHAFHTNRLYLRCRYPVLIYFIIIIVVVITFFSESFFVIHWLCAFICVRVYVKETKMIASKEKEI